MEKSAILAVVAILATASAATAEVKSSNDAGFEVSHSVTVPASTAAAYDAIVHPARWWNKDHSWSGDAANMTIDPRAGGCFCEALPAGSGNVEHARVIFAQPGKMLRLSGALGPLQGEAVTGTLTFELSPEGKGTKVTVSYVAGGYVRTGIRSFAVPVDGVIGEQTKRLGALLGAPAR